VAKLLGETLNEWDATNSTKPKFFNSYSHLSML